VDDAGRDEHEGSRLGLDRLIADSEAQRALDDEERLLV
jgi:hypothetical protein